MSKPHGFLDTTICLRNSLITKELYPSVFNQAEPSSHESTRIFLDISSVRACLFRCRSGTIVLDRTKISCFFEDFQIFFCTFSLVLSQAAYICLRRGSGYLESTYANSPPKAHAQKAQRGVSVRKCNRHFVK